MQPVKIASILLKKYSKSRKIYSRIFKLYAVSNEIPIE
jgi:hypothetical protein